ncbi:hypothetical protein ACIOHE_23650 [Streptomyces sp. NPDC087851]|uniref:hypothetical protein n=1 Tax=Streptomyces sp. NPDC087851 TaxID=3365810 RepID=UPI00381D807B
MTANHNPAVTDDRHADSQWARLNIDEAKGLAGVCTARLAKGDLILEEVPMVRRGQSANVRGQLEAVACKRNLSVAAADQYRRVSAWYTPERRGALAATGVTASYTLLREVALHTHGGSASAEKRFDSLVTALRETAADGAPYLSTQDYLRRNGLLSAPRETASVLKRMEDDFTLRAAVVDAVRTDPDVVDSVLRTLAEDPAGPDRFFDELVAEGGLDALQSATFALSRAKSEAKAREKDFFGTEKDPSPIEAILTLVLKAIKALEKPMSLDPQQIVQVLPPDHFAVLNRLCGSVSHWHELLLAAERAVTQENGEAA